MDGRDNGIMMRMNGFPPLSSLRRTLQDSLNDVLKQRFFRDRLSVAILVGALLVNGLNLVGLVLRVHPTDVPVPTRYSNLGGGFDLLGPWYSPFLIVFFALGVTLVNGYFAYHGFGRSRLASFFLLTGSGVVAIFSFIISMAFGVVR
ncbi:MAG: hypothetical protein JWN01_973 [Patescibacteria group bacterium]|nr:hypothetical protein [Patescibacteria group bacterium]